MAIDLHDFTVSFRFVEDEPETDEPTWISKALEPGSNVILINNKAFRKLDAETKLRILCDQTVYVTKYFGVLETWQ